MANVALVAPAAIITVAGTEATAAFEVDNETIAPPLGATPLSVTVPVDEPPLVIVAGLTASADRDSAAGLTVSGNERVAPDSAAASVTGVLAATAEVVTGTVALVAPAGTVTLAGMLAAARLLDVSSTVVPLAAAADARFTVQVEFAGAVTIEGEHCNPDKPGCKMFTVAPVAELRSAWPDPSEITVLSCTGAAVFTVLDETANVTVAIAPAGIA